MTDAEQGQQGHTPIPWAVEQRDGHSVGPRYVIMSPSQHEHSRIAVCSERGIAEGESALANAAFITRACNAHEALVEAAQQTAAWLEEDADGDLGVAQWLRRALLLAEPQPPEATQEPTT